MSYSQRNTPRLEGFDRQLLGIYVALVVIGWMMIYAASYKPDQAFLLFDLSHEPGKQIMFMVVCFAMMFVIMLTDWTIWRTFAIIIYIGTLLLLPGTLIFGREINGAHAWYHIGGFTFQPAELAKFGTCLAMAAYLSNTNVSLREWKSRFLAMLIFLIPAAIVLIQSDTGSALVFFSLMLVLYREGLAPAWYMLGFGTAALVILGLIFEPPYVVAALIVWVNSLLITRFREKQRVWWAVWAALIPMAIWWKDFSNWLSTILTGNAGEWPLWTLLIPQLILFAVAFFLNYWKKNSQVQGQLQIMAILLTLGSALVFVANFACYTVLAPHQQQRIKIWLKPSEAAADARGSAYNLLHSKMAIGSGGFMGKGLLDGNMTNLRFVPEQSTDFIFCTIGEEQGFVGVVAIVSLFTWLLLRITTIAERQRSNFSRIYAYSVAGIIFMHFIVNIGMTMGLFPIIGIPLPFISYGGSSLIGFTLMIAVLLKLDSNRNLA